MCAVIGVYSENYSKELVEIIKKLFYESEIRGLHYSGASYLKDGVKTELGNWKEFNLFKEKFTELNLIGHLRYSTSDIKYNQPIYDESLSVVHNGVVTQSDSSNWEKLFGLKCEGKNDSELIFKCIKKGEEEPLIKFKNSSISALSLDKQGVTFFRNGSRPLWFTENEFGIFIASTKDILKRVFGYGEFQFCEAGWEYSIISSKIKKRKIEGFVDLQGTTICSEYYKTLLNHGL